MLYAAVRGTRLPEPAGVGIADQAIRPAVTMISVSVWSEPRLLQGHSARIDYIFALLVGPLLAETGMSGQMLHNATKLLLQNLYEP